MYGMFGLIVEVDATHRELSHADESGHDVTDAPLDPVAPPSLRHLREGARVPQAAVGRRHRWRRLGGRQQAAKKLL